MSVVCRLTSRSISSTDVEKPTSLAFGPDGKLYVGTGTGKIAKLTLNNDYSEVISIDVISVVAADRPILGLAFNPLDTSSVPTIYCSSSDMFHGEEKNSKGLAINGKIHAVTGSNLDVVTDIITGLPVSDHDHGKKFDRAFRVC